MTVNLVRSGPLYPGVPYAYASVAPRGSLIFTAGARPSTTGVKWSAPVTSGRRPAWPWPFRHRPAESGATLADVLKTTVFVASAERADLVAAWDVVSAAFGEHDAPSTLLGVAVLGCRPDSRDRSRRRRPGVSADTAPSQGESRAVPVGLDPGMAPPAHPDLQDVRHPPGGGAEPYLQAVRVRRAEAGQSGGSTVAACMYAGVPQQHTRG